MAFSRKDGFVWLNQFHDSFLNFLFEKITFLGDGWFIIALGLFFMLFKKYQTLAWIILLSYISSGIFAQILKHMISSPRPSVFFKMHQYQYYLDTFATSRIGFKSFPSGHTASFFALATVLSNYWKKRQLCIVLVLLSVLVGYSRIYLAHHFLIDVFAGAIIGIAFGSLSAIWIKPLIKVATTTKKNKSLAFSESPTNTLLNQ
ncbi:phosphatase PAP2 family protein [Flavobacterium crassostreae]|uniref:phosphatase PAP2 family protein n=1 Tax=Flavobacterium crassostreae TaxID=1763534 RepID=UPI0012FDB31A|nr:phosphatase PAP2 family protein [Flavobacterium crassostreae]